LFEHRFAPGAHVPVQFPPTQAWFAHVAPSRQVPVESHVCVVWPLQRFEVGLHDPEHAPPLHTFWQVAAFCHAPLASQVWGMSPSHCFVVGVHSPVHAPLRQTRPVQLEPGPHWPEVVHVSTSLFEHRVVAGSHTPTHAPSTHA